MKIIIILGIVISLFAEQANATPPQNAMGLSPNFPLRLSGTASSPQIAVTPTEATPLSPSIQQQQNGCFGTLKKVICKYCCWCLALRSCCERD